MDEFERRVRDALNADLQCINAHTVRRRSLPTAASTPHHHRIMPMVATVAAVAVVALVMGIIGTHSAGRDIYAAGGGTTAPSPSIRPGLIEVQGAAISIPGGWHAEDVSSVDVDITNAFGYCLLRTNHEILPTGCLASEGILIRLARVRSGQAVVPVQGSFQSDCTGAPTVPTLHQRPGSIGNEPATMVTITCGDDIGASSTYWAVSDRTVTVQSPFDGERSLPIATYVAEHIELTQWSHVIQPPTPGRTLSPTTAG